MNLLAALVIATLLFFAIVALVPQAQALTTYTYDDTDGGYLSITATTPTTVTWVNLRTQDRAAILSHKLHPRSEVSGYDWETSPNWNWDSDYEVRPLDDIALRLKVVVQSFSVAGDLTIDGTDWKGSVISEVISIAANGTYQTTNYFRTVTNLADDTVLTCEWQLWQDRWGIFGYNPGYPTQTNQYILQAYLTVGNNITFTPAATITAQYGLTLRTPGDGSGTYGYIHVDSGGTATFGKVEDATSKATSFGVQLSFLSSLYSTVYNDGGTVNFYGTDIAFYVSQIISSTTGSTTRVWGCKVNGQSGTGFQGEGYDFFNVIVNKQAVFVNAGSSVFSGTIDQITVASGMGGGLIQGYGGMPCNVTVSNVYARNVAYIVWVWGPQAHTSNYTLVDFDVDTWTFLFTAATNWTGRVLRQYTFDLTVTSSANTPIEDANVTLRYYGQGGGTFGTWLTDSNGEIPMQKVMSGFYNRTGGNTIYSYNPYRITITKDNYITYDRNFTQFEKKIWEIALLEVPAPALSPYAMLLLGVGFGFLLTAVVFRTSKPTREARD